MQAKHAIVINKQGYKVEFVLVDFIEENGEVIEKPMHYTLKDGESLIYKDISTALSMIAPRWNGTAWVETGTLEITPEIFKQLQESKLNEANAVCQSTIYAGIDVETSEGVKHFSLAEHDQKNLSEMVAMLKDYMAGLPTQIDLSDGIPYHADGDICKRWSPEDFTKIATAATAYIFYHQTYCNHLRAYIKRIEDYNELKAVTYGMELPEDLQASMNSLLGGGSIA